MFDLFMSILPELVTVLIAVGTAIARTTDSAIAKRLSRMARNNEGEIITAIKNIASSFVKEAEKDARAARTEAADAKKEAAEAKGEAKQARREAADANARSGDAETKASEAKGRADTVAAKQEKG